jgi:hypothetical protein
MLKATFLYGYRPFEHEYLPAFSPSSAGPILFVLPISLLICIVLPMFLYMGRSEMLRNRDQFFLGSFLFLLLLVAIWVLVTETIAALRLWKMVKSGDFNNKFPARFTYKK